MLDPSTPIIVGVGQITEKIERPDYRGLSNVELAAEAARRACADALGLEQLAARIDAIGALRTFEHTTPQYATPFGKSNNFPHSIARRLGVTPRTAIWAKVGGDSPQNLVSEFCEKIAAGALNMALLCGSEAISTAKHLVAEKKVVDWGESIDAPVDDRGLALKGLRTRYGWARFVRPAGERAPRPPRSVARGLRARDGATVRAVQPRGRLKPLCDRPGCLHARGAARRHRAQPHDRRTLHAAAGRARSGQPGRGAADHLGRAREHARHPREQVGVPARLCPCRRARDRAPRRPRRGTQRAARGPCRAGCRGAGPRANIVLRFLQLLPDRGVQCLRSPGTEGRRSARPHGHGRSAVFRRSRQQLLDACDRDHGRAAARQARVLRAHRGERRAPLQVRRRRVLDDPARVPHMRQHRDPGAGGCAAGARARLRSRRAGSDRDLHGRVRQGGSLARDRGRQARPHRTALLRQHARRRHAHAAGTHRPGSARPAHLGALLRVRQPPGVLRGASRGTLSAEAGQAAREVRIHTR